MRQIIRLHSLGSDEPNGEYLIVDGDEHRLHSPYLPDEGEVVSSRMAEIIIRQHAVPNGTER